MRAIITLSKKQPGYIIDLPSGGQYFKILSIESRPKLPGLQIFRFNLQFKSDDQSTVSINWHFNPAEFDIAGIVNGLNTKIQSYVRSHPNRFIQLLITAEFFQIPEGVELVVTVNS